MGIDKAPVACYAIFGPNQIEHPGKFVLRVFRMTPGFEPIAEQTPLRVTDTLEQARAALPAGLIRFIRDASDDVSLVESWI